MDLLTSYIALLLVSSILTVATTIIWMQHRDRKNLLYLWPIFFVFGIGTFSIYVLIPFNNAFIEAFGTLVILLHTLFFRYVLCKLHKVRFVKWYHLTVFGVLMSVVIIGGFISTTIDLNPWVIIAGIVVYYSEAAYLLLRLFKEERNAVYLYLMVSFLPLVLYISVRVLLYFTLNVPILRGVESKVGAPIILLYLFLHVLVLVAIIYSTNTSLIQSLHYEQANLERAMLKMKELAERDELTKIYNRRYVNNAIRTETIRLNRYGGDSSLILIDIDHFKDVNDKWGHDIGDYVLITLADLVQENLRATDTLGRWGGEEFMILLPHTTMAQAILKAEQLRLIIEQHVLRHNIRITCSFGVSTKYSGESHKTWIKRADVGLYDAKETGRNQVCKCESITLEDSPIHEFTWTEEFLCNIPIIDDAHIQLMNTIKRLIKQTFSHEEMSKRLDLLLEDCARHFSEEEQEMRKYAFPLVVQHKHIHNRLIVDTSQIVEKYQSHPDAIDLLSVLVVLEELIVDHLMQEDIKFFQYLKAESPIE